MPIDPSISLDATGAGAPPQPGNALGAVSNLVSIQNSLNQNKLFQQTFQARQRAGQIIATAPDLETGLKNLYADPVAAPFAAEFASNVRQGMVAQTEQANLEQTGMDSAYTRLAKNIASMANNPGGLGTAVSSAMATMPAQYQQKMQGVAQNVLKSLTEGLPADQSTWTPQQMAQFNKNIAGVATSALVSPTELENVLGKQDTRNIGNKIVSGVTTPAAAGGGFTSANDLGIGAPAGYQNINGVPTASPSVSANGNALGGGPSNNAPPVTASTPPIPGAPAPAPPSAPMAGDGKPLIPQDYKFTSPSVAPGAGAAGLNVLSGSQRLQNDDLQKEFNGPGLRSFQMAQLSQDAITHMNNDIDTLAQGGGFLVPGAAASARFAIAKAANTFAQATGATKLPFDPKEVASLDDFNKQTQRMGTMVTSQLLGGQKEAASVIERITSSVPGMDNSLMGSKLVSGGIAGILQRVIDERNFTQKISAQNQGNIAGAAEEFNRLHPPEEYANKVLAEQGLLANGKFANPQAVAKAMHNNYLTQEQGLNILRGQFKPEDLK